ncbi:LutC/YkgG family protein [Heliorestis convoluta]|uniref:LUD domain-containing protein n=1 Tax=Heliorestis convoluta TaxID=356322 RepID=A0A5Q2MY05_9FIRM|nr:lactate utilization protein [Heliorestis convoluta]QGG46253.1 hypothetical protein FTV88_0074 [Heliorestis convoluta]
MSETDFYENIASALGRPMPQSTEKPTLKLPPLAEQSMNQETLLEHFAKNFEALSGIFIRARDWQEVVQQVRSIMAELQIEEKDVAIWRGSELIELIKAFPDFYKEGQIKKVEKSLLGITWAHGAIAETGTVALMAGSEQNRSNSLLPPSHLAIFSQKELVATLGEAFQRLAYKDYRALNLITGPSRTSDIEMDLTIGVHGPGKMYIIYIEST